MRLDIIIVAFAVVMVRGWTTDVGRWMVTASTVLFREDQRFSDQPNVCSFSSFQPFFCFPDLFFLDTILIFFYMLFFVHLTGVTKLWLASCMRLFMGQRGTRDSLQGVLPLSVISAPQSFLETE